MVDSHLPRFAQTVQALVLAIAFLTLSAWLVPLLALVMAVAAVGGPRWNLFAHVYTRLPIPPGDPEPAAPPRFAQSLGAVFLAVASGGLYLLEGRSTAWWVVGWGPALAVALLAGLAASTTF